LVPAERFARPLLAPLFPIDFCRKSMSRPKAACLRPKPCDICHGMFLESPGYAVSVFITLRHGDFPAMASTNSVAELKEACFTTVGKLLIGDRMYCEIIRRNDATKRRRFVLQGDNAPSLSRRTALSISPAVESNIASPHAIKRMTDPSRAVKSTGTSISARPILRKQTPTRRIRHAEMNLYLPHRLSLGEPSPRFLNNFSLRS
jgi:hypothetical protein